MKETIGKMVRVNLTSGEILEESAKQYEERFFGGRGVGAWILFHEMGTGTDPLDPESMLIFCTGPLTGTSFPGASRLSIESKNCSTNGVNWANFGGYFGAELKRAGWSYILVEGKAERPIYLSIQDEKVTVRSAAHLWGADAWETEKIIHSDLQDPHVKVAAIGAAGENQVPMAIIVTNQTRAAGSGGVGAIMGSKNLKAIAVRGSGTTPVADAGRFQAVVKRVNEKLEGSEITKAMRELGTFGSLITPVNNLCGYPFRNTQDDHFEDVENSPVGLAKWKKTGEHRNTCFGCPIQCARSIMEAAEGPYEGLKIGIPENNTFYGFAARLNMSSPSNILKVYELISRHGLDNDQVAVAISWAFECYERGILTTEDTDGLELTWGNDLAVIALVRKIVHQEGFGKLLGQGSKKASEVIGKGSEYYSTALKGQDNLDALRACKGWGFGNVVSLRGGRHLDGAPSTEFFTMFPAEVSEKLFGVSTAYMPTEYEGKGKLVAWFSHFKAAIDALGACYFTSWWTSPEFCGPDEYAEALSAAGGREISREELMKVGQRIYNVEKAFNTLHAGFSRGDDYPPQIYMKEPIKSGMYKGELISEEGHEKMLNEFYEVNGWDKKTGWQTKVTLDEVGLPEVAARLKERSRLLE